MTDYKAKYEAFLAENDKLRDEIDALRAELKAERILVGRAQYLLGQTTRYELSPFDAEAHTLELRIEKFLEDTK